MAGQREAVAVLVNWLPIQPLPVQLAGPVDTQAACYLFICIHLIRLARDRRKSVEIEEHLGNQQTSAKISERLPKAMTTGENQRTSSKPNEPKQK